MFKSYNNISLLFIFIELGCVSSDNQEIMSNNEKKHHQHQELDQKVIRQGNTITAVHSELSFEIPGSWVRWYEENENHPNIHLTAEELAKVKEAEGEWDMEFAKVVNAILPFDKCIVHAGSEGWGANGISYKDLQLRVYDMTGTWQEIEQIARSKGIAVIKNFAPSPVVQKQDSGVWKQVSLKYFLRYEDYGANAIVELRMKNENDRLIVFAFMYTDHADQDKIISRIIKSIET